DGIAVRVGIRQVTGTDGTARTALVHHHNGLTKLFGKVVCHNPAHEVCRATGSKRNNHSDGFFGVGTGGDGRATNQRKGNTQASSEGFSTNNGLNLHGCLLDSSSWLYGAVALLHFERAVVDGGQHASRVACDHDVEHHRPVFVFKTFLKRRGQFFRVFNSNAQAAHGVRYLGVVHFNKIGGLVVALTVEGVLQCLHV